MRLARSCTLVLACLLLSTPAGIRAAEPESIRPDEEAVRHAGLGVDGKALQDFFRTRTPNEKTRQNLEALISQLGHKRYRVRENATRDLVVLGPPALAPLRKVLGSKDLEVVRRAKRCIEAIERSIQPDLLASAARLLAHRKPDGVVETLLNYLPYAPDEYVADEIRVALVPIGFIKGKPSASILDALDDTSPARRGAAGEVLARAGGEKEKTLARALLKDTDVSVRLRVALALVESKDREAVGSLVDLLPDVPDDQRWRAEQLLPLLAGDRSPATFGGTTEREWKEFCRVWSRWWRDNGAKLDLARLDLSSRMRGLNLLVQMLPRTRPGVTMPGRVCEIGMDGKVRWEINDLNYPVDAQVVGPNRVLITEYRGRQVTERNFKGDILWRKQCTTYPMSAQRLPNGNTLINLRSQVVEVDRGGKEVFTYSSRVGTIVAAGRARNGQTVVVDYRGTCTYLDSRGREVKQFSVNSSGLSTIGTHVDVLPNGNIVVPQYSQNRVVEFDSNGRKVWEATGQRPTSAVRLPNGHTLITSRYSRLVEELDRTGKRVWQYQGDLGNILHVKRR